MVKGIYPGGEGSSPRGFTALNGVVYFATQDDSRVILTGLVIGTCTSQLYVWLTQGHFMLLHQFLMEGMCRSTLSRFPTKRRFCHADEGSI